MRALTRLTATVGFLSLVVPALFAVEAQGTVEGPFKLKPA